MSTVSVRSAPDYDNVLVFQIDELASSSGRSPGDSNAFWPFDVRT
jgi:hypothetical protein